MISNNIWSTRESVNRPSHCGSTGQVRVGVTERSSSFSSSLASWAKMKGAAAWSAGADSAG